MENKIELMEQSEDTVIFKLKTLSNALERNGTNNFKYIKDIKILTEELIRRYE